ncbi:MAG: crossover junction endodeoxyribonuclease RuvC [Oscillospiraceae bacterium]|nr:crossover junction endodeoxyribonuclease RuvC [Oscillospiraceae bacterium]
MRIVGIDPGYAIVGYGVVDHANNRFRMCEYGAITTEAHTPFDRRLFDIDAGLNALLERARPDALAIEKLYFNSNQKTAIDVAQARGVCVLAAVKAGVPIFEYTPLQVKMSVVGYGRAEKKQVMEMTRILLGLEKVPRPDDAADALAIAICHAHSASSRMSSAYLQNLGR